MRHSIESQMFVRRFGQRGDDDAILYLHGLGESGLCFESLARHPRLVGFRQLIPDLPGYGRSPWCEEPLSFAALVDHLATWLEACDEGPVTLLGHSMGGVLAQVLAERHPGKVARIVNVDGNVCEADCVFSGQAAAMSSARFCSGGFAEMRDRIYRDGIDDEALRGYYASLRLCDPRAYHANSTELLDLSRREELAERMAGLEVPGLYIAGVPRGASDRSRAMLRRSGARLVEICPSGHWPFLDQPDAFVDAVVSFVTISK